jgi:predicted phosphodiesterase
MYTRKPTFRVFSDLHLEHDFWGPTNVCKEITSRESVDYLILAGDIVDYSNKDTLFPSFIHHMLPHYKNIFYILGNHEYYSTVQRESQIILDDYRDLCQNLGVILLENEYIEIPDIIESGDDDNFDKPIDESEINTSSIILYGCTFWPDMSKEAYYRMSDSTHISHESILDMHKKSQMSVQNFVSQCSNSNTDIMVVTHHLPSFSLIDPKYHFYGESLNSGFASHSEYLFQPPIRHWVYGHTHTAKQTIINNINFWCNPFGYPGENEQYQDCIISCQKDNQQG